MGDTAMRVDMTVGCSVCGVNFKVTVEGDRRVKSERGLLTGQVSTFVNGFVPAVVCEVRSAVHAVLDSCECEEKT